MEDPTPALAEVFAICAGAQFAITTQIGSYGLTLTVHPAHETALTAEHAVSIISNGPIVLAALTGIVHLHNVQTARLGAIYGIDPNAGASR